MTAPEPPAVPPIEGRPPQPVTEPDLVRAGRELIAAGDNQWNRWVVLDVAHWLCGELGNPGSGWPVRLPLAACGVHAPAAAVPDTGQARPTIVMDVGLWRYRLARLRSRFWDLPGTWVLAEVWDRGTYPVRRALCRADRWHDVGCRGVTCCPEFQRLVRGAR